MIGENPTHANFSVNDLGAAKNFYVDKLGFKIKRQNDQELMLESGAGTRVNIYLKEDHRPWDATVFGIEVNDVHEAALELENAGISIERLQGTDENGVMNIPDYGEAAWFKDPAGNWICVSHITA